MQTQIIFNYMTKKIIKDTYADYQKIRTVCQIMINDLSDKVLKKEDIKMWKENDSVLEILTKLVAVLSKLENTFEDEKVVNNITTSISKNDYLAIAEFIKDYDIENSCI
jgi:hypothetical protein